MDQLQLIRFAFWPFLVAACAYLEARALFWLTGRQSVGRTQAYICAVVAGMAWLATSMMAAVWDNSYPYWLAFTVGLGVMALTAIVTCVSFFVKDYKNV